MLINKDLTKEVITLYVTGNQIYAEIFSKNTHKWEVTTYFKDFGEVDIDEDLIRSTIRYIKRLWGLKNPMIITN